MVEDDRRFIPGAPEPLPAGERVLWEGKPDRAALARHAFHVQGLTLYFSVVIAAWAYNTHSALGTKDFRDMLWLQVGSAVFAIFIASVLAVACARTTWYVITDRRVVLRIGIVLPMTLNLPLRQIRGASTRMFRDGTGQIAIEIETADRIAWLILWPHARPWHLKQPQPLLRGLRDAAAVGEILRAAALAVEGASTEMTAPLEAGGPASSTSLSAVAV